MIERLSRVALLGSAWVLYLLFGLSVFSIGIMIERWIFFRVRKDNTDKLGDDLIALLRDGDLRGADHLLAKSPSIEAAVVRDSLKWIDGGPDALSEALEAEMRKKRRELERGHDPAGHARQQRAVRRPLRHRDRRHRGVSPARAKGRTRPPWAT